MWTSLLSEAILLFPQQEFSKHFQLLLAQFKTAKFTFKLTTNNYGEVILNSTLLMWQLFKFQQVHLQIQQHNLSFQIQLLLQLLMILLFQQLMTKIQANNHLILHKHNKVVLHRVQVHKNLIREAKLKIIKTRTLSIQISFQSSKNKKIRIPIVKIFLI